MIKLINKWRANRIYKKLKRLNSEIAMLSLEQNMQLEAARSSRYSQWYKFQCREICKEEKRKDLKKQKLITSMSKSIFAEFLEIDASNQKTGAK